MRRTPVSGAVVLALALAGAGPARAADVLVLDHGRVVHRDDRYLPPADPPPPPAAAAPRQAAAPGGATGPTGATGPAPAGGVAPTPPTTTGPGPATPAPSAEPHRRTVPAQLDALRAAGLITDAVRDADRTRWHAAQVTLRRLSGRRRVELGSVIATLRAVARRGELSSGRVPLAFETLERNRRWWAAAPLLAYGQRVAFSGSHLIWESYPGQGIQVQWLGTFGKANGLFLSGDHDPQLRALLDEAVGYAAPRAGGTAFESWFTFDGGRPPWVSSLTQGTAIEALSRAAVRLHEPSYLAVARSLLGIFRTPPPVGVRVPTRAGAHYLQYSFAPGLRIVNGFVQALNGLHDFGVYANDDAGRALFAAGLAELRVELPQADTGAWSLYSLGGDESDLGYHTLLRDFLRALCDRTTDQPDGGALFCDTAVRFTADLHRPPAVALVPQAPAHEGRAADVRFTLSKVSAVTLTATRGGRVVFARTATFGRGRHAFGLPALRSATSLGLTLHAVDLAGNGASTTGVLAVRR